MRIFTSFLVFIGIVLFQSNLSAQNALDFDGADDYVQTTYTGISGNGARTIEAWIKTTANCVPNAGGIQNTIADYGSFVTGGRFTFCLLWGNSIRIEAGGNGLSGSTAVNDGNWHHLAVSFDPAASTQYKLYIDGVLETQGNLTVATNTTSGTAFRIGQRIDNVNNFDGTIDEVRVWNTARTASQIAQNMNAEFCSLPTGLVAYYKFNQGNAGGANTSVTTLPDEAGSANGTLMNFALSGSSSNWVNGASITSGFIAGGLSTVNACESYTVGNNVYTTSGTYSDTIQTAGGCDSSYTIDLTINQPSQSQTSEVACISYTSPSGNYTWTQTGTYTDTILNAQQCDSIITIMLMVKQVDTSVSRTGNTLTANESNATYKWLNCADAYAVIPGAINATFTPTSNGEYAVEITKDGCTDTSNCRIVNGVGIENMHHIDFNIYPNPCQNNFTIQFRSLTEKVDITIRDITGKTHRNSTEQIGNKVKVNHELASGIYFIELSSNQGKFFQKLIVK